MIRYVRTNWYGLSYLPHLPGNVLPRCLPMMIVAGLLAGAIPYSTHYWPANDASNAGRLRDWFGDTYSMQLFGLVFGYLCISRLDLCYVRYWEGASCLKRMHSKWADTCAMVLQFDRIDDPSVSVAREPFCVHTVRLFTQLSAMAMLRLHAEERAGTSWQNMLDEVLLGSPDAAPEDSREERAPPTSAHLERFSRSGEAKEHERQSNVGADVRERRRSSVRDLLGGGATASAFAQQYAPSAEKGTDPLQVAMRELLEGLTKPEIYI